MRMHFESAIARYANVTASESEFAVAFVDLVDSRKKEMVWRGTATDTLKPERTPDEREQALSEAFAKLFEKYPPPLD